MAAVQQKVKSVSIESRCTSRHYSISVQPVSKGNGIILHNSAEWLPKHRMPGQKMSL